MKRTFSADCGYVLPSRVVYCMHYYIVLQIDSRQNASLPSGSSSCHSESAKNPPLNYFGFCKAACQRTLFLHR